MLNFLHDILVQPGSDGRAEYASLALVCVAAVNLAACAAVRWGSPARIFEAGAGVGVALACVVTLLVRGTYYPRQVIGTCLVTAWGARLSAHLYARDAPKEVLNVGVRVVWGMLCAAPVVVCNTRQEEAFRSTRLEAVAVALAVACICGEMAADAQKAAWHAAHPVRPGRGDVEPPVCASGLWAWSRHPNLFFELGFHWCIYAVVRPVEAPALALCPATLTVLVLTSPGGVLAQEAERERAYGLYPSYMRYKDSTPAVVPVPSARRALEACSPACAEAACCECGA